MLTFLLRYLNDQHLRDLSKHIECKMTHLEFDAFAYSEHEIDLRSFGEHFNDIGSDRSRSAIVAFQGATPIAALVADLGDEGSNVFNLLNRSRIIWFADDAKRFEIKRALLSNAVTLYKSAGKMAFVFIDRDHENDDIAIDMGYDFVSEGIRWLARTDIMPAWRSYIEDIMGIQGDSDLDARPVSETFGTNLNAIQTECG